jgi:acetyl-CoA acyltransferase 1
MGWTSEMVAQTYNISRQKQDEYALTSHTRAAKVSFSLSFVLTFACRGWQKQTHVAQALGDGIFADEILPVELRGTVVSVDDTVRPNVSAEGLAALKPSFPEWGGASTTAGNASGVGDGAGLCILTTRARAQAEGYDVLAKFVGTAVVGVEPRHMGIAPIYAIPKVLAQTGLDKQDIDVYEVRALFISLCWRFLETM